MAPAKIRRKGNVLPKRDEWIDGLGQQRLQDFLPAAPPCGGKFDLAQLAAPMPVRYAKEFSAFPRCRRFAAIELAPARALPLGKVRAFLGQPELLGEHDPGSAGEHGRAGAMRADPALNPVGDCDLLAQLLQQYK